MRPTRALVIACGIVAAMRCAVAEPLRCDGGIVDEGMTMGEVLAKCGEPTEKRAEDVPVRVRRPNGFVAEVGTTRIEHWTYDRGYGRFPALLTFDEGRLEKIELMTGR